MEAFIKILVQLSPNEYKLLENWLESGYLGPFASEKKILTYIREAIETKNEVKLTRSEIENVVFADFQNKKASYQQSKKKIENLLHDFLAFLQNQKNKKKRMSDFFDAESRVKYWDYLLDKKELIEEVDIRKHLEKDIIQAFNEIKDLGFISENMLEAQYKLHKWAYVYHIHLDRDTKHEPYLDSSIQYAYLFIVKYLITHITKLRGQNHSIKLPDNIIAMSEMMLAMMQHFPFIKENALLNAYHSMLLYEIRKNDFRLAEFIDILEANHINFAKDELHFLLILSINISFKEYRGNPKDINFAYRAIKLSIEQKLLFPPNQLTEAILFSVLDMLDEKRYSDNNDNSVISQLIDYLVYFNKHIVGKHKSTLFNFTTFFERAWTDKTSILNIGALSQITPNLPTKMIIRKDIILARAYYLTDNEILKSTIGKQLRKELPRGATLFYLFLKKLLVAKTTHPHTIKKLVNELQKSTYFLCHNWLLYEANLLLKKWEAAQTE